MSSKVDDYINESKKWQLELAKLRELILDCDLEEGLKWGVPCYTFEDSNIVLIHVFKEYCAILFFKGALLKDTKGVLIQQTENTQATRQIRFTSPQQVDEIASVIKAYIREAIKVEKSGLKVDFKKTEEFAVPEEFQHKLDEIPALKAAFEALTPGRQRAYLLHFAAAKQSKTREARVEKCMPKIFDGVGLNDLA
ncbi:YdeI/OmpD-associated family protein [Oxalobacteraceae bacterium]|nr:YdeI/OmpD-associated family protein [Oxalobacteraceae bacterium]